MDETKADHTPEMQADASGLAPPDDSRRRERAEGAAP